MKTLINQARDAVGYCRVSTADQAQNGVSLQAQQAKIAAWCEMHGYNLLGVFEDAGISGTRQDRPALTEALKSCGKGTALIVYSLSRLGRSTRCVLELAEQLERAGADLVSLSENIDSTSAGGRMMFRMLAVLAEFERDVISERTAAALLHKKAKGEFVGEAPYGKRLAPDGVHLLPHPAEQAVIKRVLRLRTRRLSLRGIAAALTKEGHKPRGREWHAQTVLNILSANQA